MTVDQARVIDIDQKCSQSYTRPFILAVNAIAEVEFYHYHFAAQTCAVFVKVLVSTVIFAL